MKIKNRKINELYEKNSIDFSEAGNPNYNYYNWKHIYIMKVIYNSI